MGYLTRQERVELTLAMLQKLNDKPQSLSTLAADLGKSRDVLWHIFQKLKRAKMIDVVVGIYGGIKSRPGVSYDELSVRTALNYSKAPKFHSVQCNTCDEKKKRKLVMIELGKSIFVDELERKWAGRKCPDCVVEKINAPNNTTTRKCMDCGEFLPAARWRKCFICQPVLPDIDDDYVYHSANTSYTKADDLTDDGTFEISDWDTGDQGTFTEHQGWYFNCRIREDDGND